MNKQIIVTADFSRKNGEPERRQIELSVSEDIARHLSRISLSSLDKKLLNQNDLHSRQRDQERFQKREQ